MIKHKQTLEFAGCFSKFSPMTGEDGNPIHLRTTRVSDKWGLALQFAYRYLSDPGYFCVKFYDIS